MRKIHMYRGTIMLFTNKFNLPDTLVRAAQVNEANYDRGKVNRSVTQLISPPRIDMLRKAHFKEFEKDISEEWWALFGSAVHHILELGAAPNQKVEERLFMDIDGWTVSGMADLQEFHKEAGGNHSVTISDYKVTTAFALMKDEIIKPEWEQQLNLLAYLVHHNKLVTIRELQVVAIVRDWQRQQAATDPLYPVAPVVKLRVPCWSLKRQEHFLRERVALHRLTEMLHELDEPLPECSDEERWTRESKWAVMKNDNTKASKVFDNEPAATAYVQDKDKGKDRFVVQSRPGKAVRCEGDYCGVAKWCDQYQRTKLEG
jgi:hypothetical protein